MSTSTLLRSAIVAIAIAFGSIGSDVLTILPWALLILTLDLVAGSILSVGFGQPKARRSQALILTVLGAGIAGAAIASIEHHHCSDTSGWMRVPERSQWPTECR